MVILTPLYGQPYEEVVLVDSTDMATLYERSLRWFVQNADNSNYVIKLKDPDKGEVYAKLSFETTEFRVKGGMNDWASVMNRTIVYKAKVNISAQILSKDSRYKYFIEVNEVEKIEKLNDGNYARMQKTKDVQEKEIHNYIEQFINSIIEDIKKHMSIKSDFENRNW